jgi:hypothetical protein
MAATTVLVCPVAVLKAMRVAPNPLKESVPAFAVEMSGSRVAPPLVERRSPSPKYESEELSASPVPTRITLWLGLEFPG